MGRLGPLVLLVLVGMALRLVPLTGDPLHQDEALYAYWGRLISSGRDSWLATAPVDKPPLVPYLIGLSQAAFGAREFAVRMPGLAASLLSVPLAYVLARRLYGQRSTAWIAAAVLALTPYPVLFGATAFTDPLLVGLWLAACYAALTAHWGWAGLLLGLVFASKQQAIVLAPLVVGLGWMGCQGRPKRTQWKGALARLASGVLPIVAAVFAWDRIRIAHGAAAGFWGQSVDSFGGLRLIWSPELAPRLDGWIRLEGYLLAWPGLAALCLITVGLLVVLDLSRERQTRAALADILLATFVVFYLCLHWLLAFPIWDRYLLPIVPLMGLLLGRVAALVGAALKRYSPAAVQFAFLALLTLTLLGGGWAAARGRIPVGGDHGAYDGITQVIAYLRRLPVGTVLYDRWLSWHYDFYLFDAYLYRAGFPSPRWLAADAAAFFDGRPRYLVLPSWESTARLKRTLSDAGLEMSPVLETHRRDGTTSFVVYALATREASRP